MVMAIIIVTTIVVMIKNITIMAIEKAVKQKKLEILGKVNISGSMLPIEMGGIMAIVLADIKIIIVITLVLNIIITDIMMDTEQKSKATITKINTNGNTPVIVMAGTMATLILAMLNNKIIKKSQTRNALDYFLFFLHSKKDIFLSAT